MKVSVRTTLPCSIDTAWEALHTPAVFRRVSAPFTTFRTGPQEDLPEGFSPDTSYPVTVMAMGLIPIGRQTIYLTDHVEDWATRSVVDSGRGESGPSQRFDTGGTKCRSLLGKTAGSTSPISSLPRQGYSRLSHGWD